MLSAPTGSLVQHPPMPFLPPEPIDDRKDIDSHQYSHQQGPSPTLSAPLPNGHAAAPDSYIPSIPIPNSDKICLEDLVEGSNAVAQDAEGSPDPESADDAPPFLNNGFPDDAASEDSSSSQSPRPGKRKTREEDDDYMIQDPELYGLRRSVGLVHSSNDSNTDPAIGPFTKCPHRMSIFVPLAQSFPLTYPRSIAAPTMTVQTRTSMFVHLRRNGKLTCLPKVG